MQITIALVFLHANIARYFYFLVTIYFLVFVFHKGVNSIRADESSPFVPTRCLLSLVLNGDFILLPFMSVNSIRALKLSAIVPRILNKKEAFISGWFLGLCSSSLFIFDEFFFSVRYLFKVKSMKTTQMFFEDYVAPSKSAI